MRWFRRQGERHQSVEDQREFERIRMILGVVCRQAGKDFNIFTDDVSVRGLKFVSQHPVLPGNEATLYVMLHPEGRPLALRGEVVWVKAEGEQQFVGGIAFRDTPAEAERQWADFISRNRSENSEGTSGGGR